MAERFDPEPAVQTPGLQLSSAPVPRVQQLIGVFTGAARAGIDSARQMAASSEMVGRSAVNAQMASDRAAAQTAGVIRQAESTMKEAWRRRRLQDTQTKAMNVLMARGADDPEWLHRNAVAEFQNARSAEEKGIWFGLVERANKMREQNNLTQERDAARQRKEQYDLAHQTARIELQRLVDRLENDPRLRQQLIGDGSNIHENLIEYVIGQIAEAVPELGKIRRSDPNYEMKKQMRDDLILALTERSASIASALVREHRHLGDEDASRRFSINTSAAIDTWLGLEHDPEKGYDAYLITRDFLDTFAEQEIWNGGGLSPAERANAFNAVVEDAINRIASLENDLPIGKAMELRDALLEQIISRHPEGDKAGLQLRRIAEQKFEQRFSQTLDRRINREVQRAVSGIRAAPGGKELSNEQITAMIQEKGVFGDIHSEIRNEAGVPFDMEDLTDRQAAKAATIDGIVEAHINNWARYATQINQRRISAMNSALGNAYAGDANAAEEYTLRRQFDANQGKMDHEFKVVYDVALMEGFDEQRRQLAEQGFDPTQVDHLTVNDLEDGYKSLVNQFVSANIIRVGEPLPEELTDEMKQQMSLTQIDEFWSFWQNVDRAEAILYGHRQSKGNQPLPSDMISRMSHDLGRGSESAWRRAQTYLDHLPEWRQNEFIGSISGENAPTVQTMLEYYRASRKLDIGSGQSTDVLLYNFAKLDAKQETLSSLLGREQTNVRLEAIDPQTTVTKELAIAAQIDASFNIVDLPRAGIFRRKQPISGNALIGEIERAMGPRTYEQIRNWVAVEAFNNRLAGIQDPVAVATTEATTTLKRNGWRMVEMDDGSKQLRQVGRGDQMEYLSNVLSDREWSRRQVAEDLLRPERDGPQEQVGRALRFAVDRLNIPLDIMERNFRREPIPYFGQEAVVPVVENSRHALMLRALIDHPSLIREFVSDPTSGRSHWKEEVQIDYDIDHPSWTEILEGIGRGEGQGLPLRVITSSGKIIPLSNAQLIPGFMQSREEEPVRRPIRIAPGRARFGHGIFGS